MKNFSACYCAVRCGQILNTFFMIIFTTKQLSVVALKIDYEQQYNKMRYKMMLFLAVINSYSAV